MFFFYLFYWLNCSFPLFQEVKSLVVISIGPHFISCVLIIHLDDMYGYFHLQKKFTPGINFWWVVSLYIDNQIWIVFKGKQLNCVPLIIFLYGVSVNQEAIYILLPLTLKKLAHNVRCKEDQPDRLTRRESYNVLRADGEICYSHWQGESIPK